MTVLICGIPIDSLDKHLTSLISFPLKVSSIRQRLASIYEGESDWKQAATVLVGIPLETAQK